MTEPQKNPKESPASDVSIGDETTVEAFIEAALAEFESPLTGYASSILRDPDRARDVVQDTFIRLCQQDLQKIRDSLKTWLFTVCRNRCLDILRKEKRNQPLDEIRWQRVAGAGLQPDEQLVRDEKLAQIMRFLDRLSENQREVILLKFQQGLSYQEIVEITRLSSGNVGFLIHTGLKRLRELLPPDLKL